MNDFADLLTDETLAPARGTSKFNGYRMPVTDAGRALAEEAERLNGNFEKHFNLRQRARRPADEASMKASIGALVTNAARQYLLDPEGRVSVPIGTGRLGKRDRYRSPAENKQLPQLLKNLASKSLALLEYTKGVYGFGGTGTISTIKAGPTLVRRITDAKLTLHDFGLDAGEEIVVLKGRNDPRARADFHQYHDTPMTQALREQMKAINAGLADADLQWLGERPIDVRDVRLRRYFNNGRFDQGGRMFGGFWQTLPKADRGDLLMDGEPLVIIDFRQMAPRLLYAMAGAAHLIDNVPDLYDIPQGAGSFNREGIKRLMSALMFCKAEPTRWPAGIRKHFGGKKQTSDDDRPGSEETGMRVSEPLKAIREVHHAIWPLYFTGIGYTEMRLESDVLVHALLRLHEFDVIALPIHDAVMVKESDARIAVSMMIEAGWKVANTYLPVSIDGKPWGGD